MGIAPIMVAVSLANLSLGSAANTLAGQSAAWRVGQLIAARAESPSDHAGRFVLRVGGEAVTAVSPVAIQAGTPLTLVVQSLGPPPSLQLVTPRAASDAVIAHHLRWTLPTDGSIRGLLNVLLKSGRSDRVPAPVRAMVEALIRNLPRIGELDGAAPIRRALGDSGVFLEAKLGDRLAPPDVQRDFKAQLLRLSEALRGRLTSPPRECASSERAATVPAPSGAGSGAAALREIVRLFSGGGADLPQLARAALASLPQNQLDALDEALQAAAQSRPPRAVPPPMVQEVLTALLVRPAPCQAAATLLALVRALPLLEELQQGVERALARVLTTQLLPLAEDPGDSARPVLVELPIRDCEELDTVRLRFEAPDRERDAHELRVTLDFDCPELGPLQSRLTLRGHRLAALFTAERPATVDGIGQHLPLLHRALAATGLEVDGVRVARGEVARRPPPPRGISLLDEHA